MVCNATEKPFTVDASSPKQYETRWLLMQHLQRLPSILRFRVRMKDALQGKQKWIVALDGNTVVGMVDYVTGKSPDMAEMYILPGYPGVRESLWQTLNGIKLRPTDSTRDDPLSEVIPRPTEGTVVEGVLLAK